MRIYTVHAPTGDEPGEAPDKVRAVFIKDGIAWLALFVPFLWILWHRLWLTLVWFIVFVLVVAWIGRLMGEDLATAAGLLGQILFALEANNLRRWSLHSRGWTDIGESFGRNAEEAEMRYFLAPAATARAAPPAAAQRSEAIARAAYPQRPSQDDDAIFGLFPEPER